MSKKKEKKEKSRAEIAHMCENLIDDLRNNASKENLLHDILRILDAVENLPH